MRIFAGIDSGGTRARLALAREDGSIAGYAEGRSCCFTDQGMDGARESLLAVWNQAWQSAQLPPRPVEALYLGLGSILAEADERINCDMASSLELARPGAVRAGNDAWNAMVGGLCGSPGILLIAGTGSACLGRNAGGDFWRAGGWGYKLDDRGSAYALGRAAMIAATRDADGRGPATLLRQMTLRELRLGSMPEIFRLLHHEGGSRCDIAAFAPRVIDAAKAGDRVAADLLDEGASGLMEMVLTVAGRVQLDRPLLALTGGLLCQSAFYRELFLHKIKQALPGIELANNGLPPVLGAVMLAAETVIGKPLPPSFIENLRRSAASMDSIL